MASKRQMSTIHAFGWIFLVISVIGADAEVGKWNLVGAPEGQECLGVIYLNGTAFVRVPSQAGGNSWDAKRFSYESSDGGSEWQESEIALPSGESEFVDPVLVIGSKFYGHCAGDMYTSEDNGKTWNAMSGPSGYSSRYSHIYWSGSILSSGRFICDLETGTWTQVPTYSSGIHQLSNFGQIGDRMVAVSSRNGTFYSDDDGESWTKSDFEPECASIFTVNGKVYAVSDESSGLFVSSDGGATFSNTSDVVKGGTLKLLGDRLCCIGESTLYWISEDGETVTETNAGQWTTLHEAAVTDDYLLAATDRGIFRSVDDGVTWYAANKGLGYQTIIRMSASGTLGDTLYCATKNGVWRSVSHGERWKSIGLFDKNIYDVISHEGKVYAVGRDKIYIGTVNGTDWEEISISNDGYVGHYPSLLVYDGNVYFNNTESLSLISGSSLQEKATDPGRCWVASGYVYSDKGKRTNDFSSWENLTGLNNPENIFGGFVSTGDHVYAAMEKARFDPKNDEAYRSADGVTFTGFDGGLRRIVGSGGTCWLTTICVHGDTVFAYEEDGGTNLPRIMYATSEATRWKAYANLDGQTSIAQHTNMVATETSLHLGAYRYDFVEVADAPEDLDTNEYIDPLRASHDTRGMARNAFATISGPSYGRVTVYAPAGFGDMAQIDLINPRGRILRSGSHRIPAGEGLQVSVPTTGLASGVYFVRIRSRNNQAMQWFSIRR